MVTTISNGIAWYQEAIEGYWAGIAGEDPAVRERLLRDLRATPRESVVQCFKAVMRFDPHGHWRGTEARRLRSSLRQTTLPTACTGWAPGSPIK